MIMAIPSPPQFTRERQMRKPVLNWLQHQGYLCTVESFTGHGYADIVARRFGVRPAARRIPPLLDVLIVELKLEDVAGVVRQARDNRQVCHQSYCAMPDSRLATMRPATLDKFCIAGVGLLLVGSGVRVAIEAPLGNGVDGSLIARHWRCVRHLYVKCEAQAGLDHPHSAAVDLELAAARLCDGLQNRQIWPAAVIFKTT